MRRSEDSFRIRACSAQLCCIRMEKFSASLDSRVQRKFALHARSQQRSMHREKSWVDSSVAAHFLDYIRADESKACSWVHALQREGNACFSRRSIATAHWAW